MTITQSRHVLNPDAKQPLRNSSQRLHAVQIQARDGKTCRQKINNQQDGKISQTRFEVISRRLAIIWMNISLYPTLRIYGRGTHIHDGDAVAKVDSTTKTATTASDDKEQLRDAMNAFQTALNAESVIEEEKGWTQIIDAYRYSNYSWTSDLLSRALGNRGNSRSRQGKLKEAIKDYDMSIELTGGQVADPILNRGVAHEALFEFEAALKDYSAVLSLNPSDASALNNMGNVYIQLEDYKRAVESFKAAVKASPRFAFAEVNLAIALFLSGAVEESFAIFRRLLRRYPYFDDCHAGSTNVFHHHWESLLM